MAKNPAEKGDEYTNRVTIAEKSFYRSKVLGEESIRIKHKMESQRVNVSFYKVKNV